MGDFNINYSKEILKKGKSISYIDAMDKIKHNKLEQWMCYKILKLLNFTNIATTFKKESEKTWFSSCNSSASSTTVDYIWASNNLNDIIIDFNLTRTTYSSDHAMLMFTFEHPNNSFVNLKNFNKSRDTGKSFNNRYNLNSIQKEDWVTFNNIVNEKLIRLQDIPNYSTKTQVSAAMNTFNSIIIDSLNEMKVAKIKVTPRRNNLPLALRKKYNHIHQLNSIQATVKEALYIESDQFKLKIPSSAEQHKGLKNNFDRHWRRKSNWLIKLFRQYNVRNGIALYSQTLNSVEELESVHINIVNLIDHVNNEIVKERNAWDIINEKVNSHFQNIGSSDTSPNVYNPLIEMPHPWRSVYSPKTIDDPDAIKKLIDPITVDELQLMIKTLPNHKAPGPSGISYELIKKLPSSFLKELVDFYNHILST
ncbi:13970_t:CDS:2, partial [Rhizophagus irregularis]